jgi:Uncharacterized conserved protein
MRLRDRYAAGTPAVVLAEGALGTPDGKTAHGLIQHSDLFEITAVIDSAHAGARTDAIIAADDVPAIPVVDSVDAALETDPEVLLLGVAPAGGTLPPAWVGDIETAIHGGCDIISGLHRFLGEDPHWRELAAAAGVEIIDVRRPPSVADLRVADGRIADVDATVVTVMGTDCAVGKRTTTVELYHQARRAGVDAAWVATGQTGIMLGAHAGVVIDRVPADFTPGVVEDLVTEVAATHELVFVEGQAALLHPAYGPVTLAVLHGSRPDAVVLADDPTRHTRTHFERYEMPPASAEVAAIEDLGGTTVAAISTWGDPAAASDAFGLPAANIMHAGGAESLLAHLLDAV